MMKNFKTSVMAVGLFVSGACGVGLVPFQAHADDIKAGENATVKCTTSTSQKAKSVVATTTVPESDKKDAAAGTAK